MIKGGIWKNTEDEILKAAVMKYGKNQWARVASLMNRKSAKQCKARWYEWLDPSIKKTEWTREEEEKLLHLAKLMPNQWRTIAPIVGRTAAQCLEHYERLLDMAQVKASGEAEADSSGISDPRRLRPGEIDPHPETKPARPDPIDMDEDEKEMLSEARARLANTRGKKAKRKAREKQLLEAKRLASLQKRRELKAAGIKSGGLHRKKRKYIDYGREIPFQKTAPAGFYDTSDEKLESRAVALKAGEDLIRLEELEAKRRDEEEEKNENKDRRKLRKLMKTQLPVEVQRLNDLNDPATVRRRTPLNLPEPQVTDQELEEIAKLGAREGSLMPPPGEEATAALLGDYQRAASSTLPTPLRTPKMPVGVDVILQEARNLSLLTKQQTPLLGGENLELEAGTGFEGATPKVQRIQTPNALVVSTPGRATGGNTPGATPTRTPSTPLSLRDELGLNRDDYGGITPGSTDSRAYKEEQKRLAAGLAALPEAQYTYEIALPQVDEEGADDKVNLDEDAADRDARLEHELREAEEAELRRRSTVLQRDLPRPVTVNPEVGKALDMDTATGQAEALIRDEMLKMLQHDALKYPVKGSSGKKGEKKAKRKRGETADNTQLEDLPDELLQSAKLLLELETEEVIKQRNDPDGEAFNEAWLACFSEMVYFPERQTFGRLTNASKQDRVSAMKFQFENIKEQLEKDSRKLEKLDAKLKLKTGGYLKRAQTTLEGTEKIYSDLDTACIEVACFKMIHKMEEASLTPRLEELKNDLKEQEATQKVLQAEYKQLAIQKQKLAEVIERKLNPKKFLPAPPAPPAPAQVEDDEANLASSKTKQIVEFSNQPQAQFVLEASSDLSLTNKSQTVSQTATELLGTVSASGPPNKIPEVASQNDSFENQPSESA